MANYISGAPLWAIVLFIPLFLYSIFFITGPVQQAALKAGLTSGRARNIRLGDYKLLYNLPGICFCTGPERPAGC